MCVCCRLLAHESHKQLLHLHRSGLWVSVMITGCLKSGIYRTVKKKIWLFMFDWLVLLVSKEHPPAPRPVEGKEPDVVRVRVKVTNLFIFILIFAPVLILVPQQHTVYCRRGCGRWHTICDMCQGVSVISLSWCYITPKQGAGFPSFRWSSQPIKSLFLVWTNQHR